MTTQLADQIRSLASDIDAASQEPAFVAEASEPSRNRRAGVVAFAAACLVLMNRRYQDAVRKNSILAERKTELANAVKVAARLAAAN